MNDPSRFDEKGVSKYVQHAKFAHGLESPPKKAGCPQTVLLDSIVTPLRPPLKKVDVFPPYLGREWDEKISSVDNPNFWKYGVANLVFLEHASEKKLVLDLGCGTGALSSLLADGGKAEWIIGVDLVSNMIKVARENAIKRRLTRKMCFLICDGRYLPFNHSCFEALVSRGDAFCFLVPLKTAVQELKRVMKPKAIVVLEMDNRQDWKPGSTVSTGFQRTPNGGIAYVVESFTTKRNHRSISYLLNPKGKIAEMVAGDLEFQKNGRKRQEFPLQKIREETIETRQGVLTHWPTAKELRALFTEGGFAEVQVIGDGLLMKLLLGGEEEILGAMKRDPLLFFKIEKRIIPHVDPSKAPTIILRATAP